MYKLRYILMAVLVMAAIGVPVVRAQQQTPPQTPQQPQDQSAQPIPAYRSPFGLSADAAEDANADPNALAPDTRSLAGAEDLSLGAPKTGHSFWAPYFQVSSTLDSTPLSTSGSPGWTTWTSFYGGVDLNRTSGNSEFTLTYLGGGSVSNDTGSGNAIIQQLGLAERLTFHRYAIKFLDQLAYLPEPAFGYAGVGGPALQTGGNLGLQSGLTPNQSILTPLGQRISNSFITEADTFLTPRSSLTFVGSYGILDYFDNDFDNSHEAVFQAGYNYRITRKNTIALLCRFDAFRYQQGTQSINDNSVQVSYGRRVTGRLALQISGGPDVAFSRTPISGTSAPSVGTVATTAKTRQFFWDLNSFLTYQLGRTSFINLAYNHGVTGGSGVLAGAITDIASASASRQLAPSVRGAWTLGYSRNQGVAITPGSTSITSNQTYDYWFTGVNFTRNFGRSMNLYVGYQVNYQNSNSSFCITTTCGTSFVQHQITMSVGWHPRGTPSVGWESRATTF